MDDTTESKKSLEGCGKVRADMSTDEVQIRLEMISCGFSTTDLWPS